MVRRPEIVLERDLPGIIANYNLSVGTQNTDTGGYHETLTLFYIRVIRGFVNRTDRKLGLKAICNSLARTFPLEFWSKDLLFSPKARRTWVEPDTKELGNL